MISPVHDKHFFIELSCHSFGDNCTGKTGPRHQVIKHSDVRSSQAPTDFFGKDAAREMAASFVPVEPAK
jgi:hypothetical protein